MSERVSNLGDEQGDHELDASDGEYIEMNSAQLQSIQETLNDLTLSYRFFGKSSGANLVQTALNLKSEYSGTEADHMRMRVVNRRPEFWTQHSVSRTPLLLSFAQLTPGLIVGMRHASRRHPHHRFHIPGAGPHRPACRPVLHAHQPLPAVPAPPDLRAPSA
jgi:hypothetical protein